MKTVIIITGDAFQIDLVPENETDKSVLAMLNEGVTLTVGKASGYGECRGGYLRPYGDSQGRAFLYLTTIRKPEPPQ